MCIGCSGSRSPQAMLKGHAQPDCWSVICELKGSRLRALLPPALRAL